MMLLIDKYSRYLRYEKNFSLHTEISYSTDLHQFAGFLQEHFPDVDIKSVDSDIVRMWIVSLMEAKIAARSVNRKLSTLKSFYKYLLRIGEVPVNPVKKITGPKTPKPIPSFVNNGDMEKVLEESNFDNTFESLRNHMMIELFYVTGIRRAELIGLKDTDVDFSAETIQVTGKRNKQRLIPFSDGMKAMLGQYLKARNEEIGNLSGYLFVKNDGEQLYPMLVHRIVTENLKQIPTLSKSSPHVLRHSFATSMLNNGADINAVKELLGHSSLAATEIYTHTSFEELKKIYNKAHPRA
ncbi:MAG: tyrosine-type recombinase/integrase [Prevotella sp.]|nr:tyrosine-type recombinase/integrase [Prevotella sp.]